MSIEIHRTLANQIIAQAITLNADQALWGLIDIEKQEGSFFQHPIDCEATNLIDYVLVYNQSQSQQDKIEQLHAQMLDQQRLIEIFEDTKGVVGLRAYIKQGKMLAPQELELLY